MYSEQPHTYMQRAREIEIERRRGAIRRINSSIRRGSMSFIILSNKFNAGARKTYNSHVMSVCLDLCVCVQYRFYPERKLH